MLISGILALLNLNGAYKHTMESVYLLFFWIKHYSKLMRERITFAGSL